jgi:asparagine synthase (glutamine-hydrolysing)
MCGFVGIVDLKSKHDIDSRLLGRMNNSLFHRGPDEEGSHVEPGVGLGHRRLSIIDLSTGQQPLFNEDHTVVVVYNGEIYNHEEIRRTLIQRGHTFRTRSDTEVIVHAWEEWGEDSVTRFNGMFAFALWDRNRSELFLARDRLGIKPLYYAVLANGHLIFGSEMKALLVHPELERSLNHSAVEEYFAFGYVPEPNTILNGVHKLSPGHTIRFRHGHIGAIPKQYWDLSFEQSENQRYEDAMVELVDRLQASVERRLMSEVPLGAFLSGGVDSSAVVAMMSGLMQEKVNTCSISFGDPKFNESRYAQQIADQYATNHYVEVVDSDDYGLIDTLARHYDEPFADSSAIPTYRVCELARRHVTVALSGDGGDENFAGYRRYRWHAYEQQVRSRLPQSIRGPMFGMLGRLYPKLDWAPKFLRAKTTFQALAKDSLEGFLDSVSVVSGANRQLLFSRSFKTDLAGYNAVDVLRRHAANCDAADSLSLVQYLDIKTYLPGDILTKVDRASMAHSLEVRVPILDHTFTEWVATLPSNWKLRGREGKQLLKQSLEAHLPRDVLYRDKMGFAVPIEDWFRGPLKNQIRALADSPVLAETGIFDTDNIATMIRHHQSGLRDHSPTIWALVMFEASLRNMGLSSDCVAEQPPMVANA